VRDWLYVEDHCDAIRKVLREGRAGETYNVGGAAAARGEGPAGTEVTNLDLVQKICAILDGARPLTKSRRESPPADGIDAHEGGGATTPASRFQASDAMSSEAQEDEERKERRASAKAWSAAGEIAGPEEKVGMQIAAAAEAAAVEAVGAEADRSRTIYKSLIRFVADRPGHDRRYAVDSSKIRRELGWQPRHTLDEGLRNTVAWYLAHPEWIAAIRARGDYAGWLKKNYERR